MLLVGELQCLCLVMQFSVLLFGVLYVFDEFLVGLYLVDSQVLYDVLEWLCDGGNLVFVVEYDLELMCCVQWLVDVGLQVGEYGGCVFYSGEFDGLCDVQYLCMVQYLFDWVFVLVSWQCSVNSWLELKGIYCYNLYGVDVQVLLGLLIVVIGIFGLGKFSLMVQVLFELMLFYLGYEMVDDSVDSVFMDGFIVIEVMCGQLVGDVDVIQCVVQVDQRFIGCMLCFNLVIYMGLFDYVCKLFVVIFDVCCCCFDVGCFLFNVVKG